MMAGAVKRSPNPWLLSDAGGETNPVEECFAAVSGLLSFF